MKYLHTVSIKHRAFMPLGHIFVPMKVCTIFPTLQFMQDVLVERLQLVIHMWVGDKKPYSQSHITFSLAVFDDECLSTNSCPPLLSGLLTCVVECVWTMGSQSQMCIRCVCV